MQEFLVKKFLRRINLFRSYGFFGYCLTWQRTLPKFAFSTSLAPVVQALRYGTGSSPDLLWDRCSPEIPAKGHVSLRSPSFLVPQDTIQGMNGIAEGV